MGQAYFILWRHSQPVAIVASDGAGADVMRVLQEAPDALAGYHLAWLLNYGAEQGASLLDHPDLESFGLEIAAVTEGSTPPRSALNSREICDHLEGLATDREPADFDPAWAQAPRYRYALITDTAGRFIARIGSGAGQRDDVQLYLDSSSLLEAGFELGRLNWEAAQGKTPLVGKLRNSMLSRGGAVDTGSLSAEGAVRHDGTMAALQEKNLPMLTTATMLRYQDGTPLAVLVVRGADRQLLSPSSLGVPEHDRALQALRHMSPLSMANYCRENRIGRAVDGVEVGARIQNYTSLGVYLQRQDAIDQLWEELVDLSEELGERDLAMVDVSEITDWLSPADQIRGHCSTIAAYAELGGGTEDATRIVKAECTAIDGLIERLTHLPADDKVKLREAIGEFRVLATVAGLKVSDAETLVETINLALDGPTGPEASL